MNEPERRRQTAALARHLARLGFNDVQSRDRDDASPAPLRVGYHSVVPDATTRTGANHLDVYMVMDAADVEEAQHVKRLRRAAAAAEIEGGLLRLAVPPADYGHVKERLRVLGVKARLMRVQERGSAGV